MLVSVALLVVTFYPGAMSIDSYTQLLLARGGHLGDWHPPFMAWIWGGLDAIVRGPVLMLLAQIALFLFALKQVARAVLPHSPVLRKTFIVLSILLTPVSGIVGVIWKDVWTSCLLLLGAACFLSMRIDSDERSGLRRLVYGASALFAAMLFRSNAVIAAAPLLAYGAWALSPHAPVRRSVGRALIASALCLALLGIASESLNRTLASYREFPIQSILIFDVAGVSVRTNRADFVDSAAATFPDVVRKQKAIGLSALRAAYFPSTWTPLVFAGDSPMAVTRSPEQVAALRSTWWRCVLEAPSAYLRHREDVFLQVLGVHEGPLFAPVYFDVPKESADYAQIARSMPLYLVEASPVQEALRDAVTRSSTWTVYRPWFWLLLNISLTVIAATAGGARAGLVALGLSGLAYELALFFIAPSADYRYSHWLVVSTWVLTVALATKFGGVLIARLNPRSTVLTWSDLSIAVARASHRVASRKRFLRFCLVGGVGFVVDAGVLQVLMSAFGAGLLRGRVVSYLVAATVTWALHRKYTFGDLVREARGRDGLQTSRVDEWLRFVVANAMGAAVNYGGYVLCVLNGGTFRAYPALAVAVGSALGLVFNYFASKRFVFGRAVRP